MRYRVDQLAARGGVSVDTVRYYQSQSLLPQPQREGRVAWYSDAHLERLSRIRELKDKGFTLASIGRLLDGDLDAADRALVAAVAGDGVTGSSEELLSLAELAQRTGVSITLLEAIEREGLLTPSPGEGGRGYSASDAEVVKAGLELLETGLPLSELLALARRHDEAVRATADHAVELFIRFVLDPIRGNASSEEEAAEKVVAAFAKMLPATTSLVAHHFRGVLLRQARTRIEESES